MMRKTLFQWAAGLLTVLALAACGGDASPPGDGNAHVQTLPNSLTDTSAHEAARAIPRYGPPTPPGDSLAPGASSQTNAHGQVLYAPVYSHVFYQSADRELTLAATLSIRNTSTDRAIRIQEVDYFDSEGTLVTSYLDGSRRLGPLASTYVVIEEENASGGVGANFIVEWEADWPVPPPVIETVMISTASSQGISLTSPARVIDQW